MQAALIDNFRQYVAKEDLPEFYKTIEKQFGGDTRKYVEWLWSTSVLDAETQDRTQYACAAKSRRADPDLLHSKMV